MRFSLLAVVRVWEESSNAERFYCCKRYLFSIYKSPATCMELNSFLCIEMTGRQKQTKLTWRNGSVPELS